LAALALAAGCAWLAVAVRCAGRRAACRAAAFAAMRRPFHAALPKP